MCITQINEQVTKLYESFEKMRRVDEDVPVINLADVEYHGENPDDYNYNRYFEG